MKPTVAWVMLNLSLLFMGMAITNQNFAAIVTKADNVPIVGKQRVIQGREMHWLRVDRYFTGDIDNPQVASQPVACQRHLAISGTGCAYNVVMRILLHVFSIFSCAWADTDR